MAIFANVGYLVVALRFIDALQAGVEHIRRASNAGSLRFSYELDIPELRAWSVRRFPYVILYVASDGHIDIWRVMHTRRDGPAVLSGDA